MSRKKKPKRIKLTYLTTKRTPFVNPLSFPVGLRELIEKPFIIYRDENGDEYSVERVLPHPPNKAFYELFLSPRYKVSKVRKIEDGKITSKKELRELEILTDLHIDVEGTILMEEDKNILVLKKDKKWAYNFKKEH